MNKWLAEFKETKEYKEWYIDELSIDDQSIYNEYIKVTGYPVNVWASNFAYIWTYVNSDKLYVYKALVENMLVTFILTKKGRLYLPCIPFGKANLDKLLYVIYKCARFCAKWNKISNYEYKSIINPINEVQLDYLKQHPRYQELFYEETLTGLERHFSIDKMIKLEGKDFQYIRRKINRFHSKYPNASIREYKPEDFQQVMKLGAIWEKKSGKKYRRIIDGHYFEPIIKNYQKLDHIVLVVELNGKIIGMISGGALPTGEAWWCLSKFNNEYDGLSEFLGVELAKKIHKEYPEVTYINAGSDLGAKGLSFYKERFRPVYNYKRYALFFKEKK